MRRTLIATLALVCATLVHDAARRIASQPLALSASDIARQLSGATVEVNGVLRLYDKASGPRCG